MVLASLDSAYDDEDEVVQPVRTALGAAGPRTEHMLPGLTKVGAPIPVSLPTLKPPKAPSPNERPSVYPGGRVIWREARPPTLDEARAGRRADLSNLFDVASLHQEELRRVSQLMARQPLSTPMHAPPKVAPPISPNVLSLAGLDLPYDHQQQQAALAVRTSPAQSPLRPRTQARRDGESDHGYLAAAQTDAVLAAAETIQGGAGGVVRPYMPKPSSRADVVQLQALLERRLHESSGAMGEQIRAWDDAFAEVVRQVGLHCTERGALLDEIRSRYNDWVSRLILAISELHGARERRTALAKEEAATQEDRLSELLLTNQSLQHKMSVLRRELEWSKKANAASMDGATGGSAWNAFKGMLAAEAKFGAITSLVHEIGGELTSSQIAQLLHTALQGSVGAGDGAAADAGTMGSGPGERRDRAVAEIVEQLPLEAQTALAADLLSSFNAAGLTDTVHKIGEDAEGMAALMNLQQQALDVLAASSDPTLLRDAQSAALARGAKTPEARIAAVSSMLGRLSADERSEVLKPFGVGAAADVGMGASQRAMAAAKARAGALADDDFDDGQRGGAQGAAGGESPAPRALVKSKSSVTKRREARRGESGGSAGSAAAAATAAAKATVAAALEGGGGDAEDLVHSVSGVLSMAEMLRKKHIVSKVLTRKEVLEIIGGALSMKVETDAAARASGRKRLHTRDELWRYLCSKSERRTEALQTLHNLAAALETLGSGKGATAPNRINAFRHLTGLGVTAGGVWPAVEADFYVLALQATFPQWASMRREEYALALAKDDLMVPMNQAMDTLKYLCRDGILLHRMHARVKGAAAEAVLTSSSKVEGVGLDWFMQVLMQAWEDSQLACQKALQTIFFEADDNGDGILQLDEFYAMIRERKPTMTDAEAFVIYDEALALSEQMLGYESDAILADAFTRTAIGHNLFSEIAQPLKTADEAGDDPPPRWGAAGGKNGSPDAKGGGAGGGGPDGGTKDLLDKIGVKRHERRGVSSSSSMPALPGVLGGHGVRPPLIAGVAAGGGKSSGGPSPGRSTRASIGSRHDMMAQSGGLPMLG